MKSMSTLICWAALPLALLAAGPLLAQVPATQPPATQAPAFQPPSAANTHGAPAAVASARKSAPSDAYNYIGWPQEGTVIRSTRFKVWFGARNIGVAPAGVDAPGAGHHHLLIDAPLPSDMAAAIPNDKNHLHFGSGQSETVLELAPGTHTLQLLMGDAIHVPHDPPVHSRRITIHVRPGAAPRVASAQ